MLIEAHGFHYTVAQGSSFSTPTFIP